MVGGCSSEKRSEVPSQIGEGRRSCSHALRSKPSRSPEDVGCGHLAPRTNRAEQGGEDQLGTLRATIDSKDRDGLHIVLPITAKSQLIGTPGTHVPPPSPTNSERRLLCQSHEPESPTNVLAPPPTTLPRSG